MHREELQVGFQGQVGCRKPINSRGLQALGPGDEEDELGWRRRVTRGTQ